MIGAGVVGVAAGACAVGLAWLLRAEVNASWLRSAIEEEIEASVPGLSVSLGDIRARNIPWRDSVRVDVRGSTLRYRDQLAGRIDHLVVEIDRDSLLRAAPHLKLLRVSDVALTARWDRAQVEALLAEPGSEALPTMPWVKGLERLSLEDITVALTEAQTGVAHTFTLNAGRIEAQGPKRLKASVVAQLAGPEDTATFKLTGTAVPYGAWTLNVSLYAEGLTGLAGPLHPALENRTLDVPLRVNALVRADKALSAAADVSAEHGRLVLPEFWARPVDLNSLSARLAWDGATHAARLESLAANIGGVRVQDGTVAWDAAGHAASLALGPISTRQLHALWPKGVVEGGRKWVVRNVSAGTVPRLDLTLAKTAGKEKVDLGFSFENLVVHYRKPMPPVVRGTGKARLISDTLRFDVEEGEINGLDVSGSVVNLVELATHGKAEAVIETRGRGAIYRLLQVLDSEPLGYITAFGLKPNDVAGHMTMAGTLTVPLRANVGMDDVDFTATAQGMGVGLPDVLDVHDLTQGTVQVSANRHGLEARGTAYVGPQFAHIVWNENFAPNGQPSSRYHIVARTDGDRLTRLGYDGIGALVEGPIDLTLDLVGRGQAIERGAIAASLIDSTVNMRNLGIVKQPGEAATATFNLTRNGEMYQVEDLVVRADKYRATGRGALDPRREIRHWFLDRVETPYYIAEADILDVEGQPMRLAIRGDTLDLKPLVEDILAADKEGAGKAGADSAASAPAADSVWPDMTGAGRFRNVLLYHGQKVENAALSFETNGNLLSALNFTGKLDGASDLSAHVETHGGKRRFRLEAAKAGELARALDLYANGAGGSLTVEGDMRGTGPALEIDGVARMKDFRLVEAPVLAKILGFASLTGLADTLSGRGIRFETAKVPFVLRKGIFTIDDGRIIGPALGITVEGQVQRSLGNVNLKGVVVPSYTLNSLIGKIPLLGPLVVGGEYQGLIGFNYRVAGELLDPDISVNAASGLAPGFLRLILSGAPARVKDETRDATTSMAD
ncbi:AsmA-like C-terminal region-containing protein [Pedomonas mirosovicensis]|uniref:AsmA-like C-terminal region-containing protein n=1 Tax=Pedomonas mirosovicensis TaxID=2908641 RepID=UPI002167DE55|nr:AsmA-like C-terminal region-containing protein [Pedomonas mirosovicensis]MCH8685199.1 AsmA-like C-terminal region-containing protein [Pedomonas mirosovicensis]